MRKGPVQGTLHLTVRIAIPDTIVPARSRCVSVNFKAQPERVVQTAFMIR